MNTAKEKLEILINNYLASGPMVRSDGKTNEVEIRFGTNNKTKPLTKIDYDNVVKQLYRAGFKIENEDGLHSLRIFHDSVDNQQSDIRTEIQGVDLIREYCNSNSLKTILNMPSTTLDKLKFTEKTRPKGKDGQTIEPADFDDFNLRVAFQLEQLHGTNSPKIKGIVENWSKFKKTFRHMNRVRFYHVELPFFADISIVRSSKTNKGGRHMKLYTVQDAGVFSNPETYEIEMEIDNSKIGIGTEYRTVASITTSIRKAIRIIMSGIQGTNYPISSVLMSEIQTEYMKLLHGEQYVPGKITSRNFIGPSSKTLQISDIMESNVNNVLKNYTVTDKADGDRKLLYVNGEGKIYLIDTNMTVIFTGAHTVNDKLFNSLIDGEHIKKDKSDKSINLYAAFDVYYINKKSTRDFEFCKSEPDLGPDLEPESKTTTKAKTESKYRLDLLKSYIDLLKPVFVSNTCELIIKCKSFSPTDNIFGGCSQILSDVEDGIYEYNTDGIIFTPCNLAVGSDIVGKSGPLYKSTWKRSFKWKPAEMNTIDFLVSVKKDKTGKDELHNLFQEGTNLQGTRSLIQYKTLILRCGYDESVHGYLNPFDNVINDKIPSAGNDENDDKYKPVPFRPTNLYGLGANACFANVILKEDGSNEMLMFTSEGEYFEEDMIIEFSYDLTKPAGWKWIPLRVRYDKTTELRNGFKNYGNAYHVANNNWDTIHQPITKEMISKGINIPNYIEDCGEEENDATANTGTYYNRTGDETKRTKSLRNFHNLYVKSKLIQVATTDGATLIDYAVGKAGDLQKWTRANLSFVLGIDISKDNIENRIDGACARYLNYRRDNKDDKFRAIFVNGNSGNNIRDGTALLTEKEKEITQAIFGIGRKDTNTLGKFVYDKYGLASDGFQVSSCQFALHYFFETIDTLHRFLRNLSECTKLGGYFIGTCFDGQTIFKILSDRNELVINNDDGSKMFELTKSYTQTGFPADATSIGYPINVYQETIGKTFREYLVNFDYFIRIMEDYGFVLLDEDTAKAKGLPNNTGRFEELYKQMEYDIKRNPKASADYRSANMMTPNEKQLSFMNRYFIFQKKIHVNVAKLKPPDDEPIEPKKTAKIIVKRRGDKITIGVGETKVSP